MKKNKKQKQPWEDFMTPEDYKLVTSHMSKECRKIFDDGFGDANQIMSIGSFGLLKRQREMLPKEELVRLRKRIPQFLKRLDQGRKKEEREERRRKGGSV